MTPTETLLLTFAVTVIGSGLGTTIIGALFKKRFDTQLESHKALLQRSGRIHERQVDSLLLIHLRLNDGLGYLQLATGTGKYQNQPSDRELLDKMRENLAAASAELARSRPLLSESLGQTLEDFFKKMVSGGMTYNLALEPTMQDGNLRAELVDEAKQIAHNELPALLNAIREEARKVIHG